jgi:hypothetical protein
MELPLKNLKSNNIKGRKPRTRLGIEIAAVALRLVPNCSALIVMYKTEMPDPKPRPIHSKYILKALPPPFKAKNKMKKNERIP